MNVSKPDESAYSLEINKELVKLLMRLERMSSLVPGEYKEEKLEAELVAATLLVRSKVKLDVMNAVVRSPPVELSMFSGEVKLARLLSGTVEGSTEMKKVREDKDV